MTFWKKLTSLFKDNTPTSTHWENTGFGLLFSCVPSQQAFKAGECLQTYRYLILQQLLETGNARKKGDKVHVDNDVLCSLDETSREILGLPEPCGLVDLIWNAGDSQKILILPSAYGLWKNGEPRPTLHAG